MELAKNLAEWRDRSPEQWLAAASRYLPPVVVAVLVLLFAFRAADVTWRLLESPVVDEVPTPVAASPDRAAAPREAYDSLRGWAPFGQPPAENAEVIAVEDVVNAPDTSLNLTLVGLFTTLELPERGSVVIADRGSAIISSGRGQQKLYWSGDPIEDAGNTTLHSVFTDRVLLDRGGGRLETLRWPENDRAAAPNSRVATRTAPRRPPPQNLNAAVATADAVGEAAQLLSEHMQIAMHTDDNGQMIGFRLQPRGDGQVFEQLGLQGGDVLTSVNGVQLDNVRNTAQVLQSLGETPQATVTVRRDNVDQVMVLDIGQIERLAESLQ